MSRGRAYKSCKLRNNDQVHLGEYNNRFSLLESITTDSGVMFTRKKIKEFAKDYGIKLLHSTFYYAQANR